MKALRIDEAQARTAIAVGLAPGDGVSVEPSDQVIAECLRRSLCWLASGGRSGQEEPVYVTSLMNQAREQLSPLWLGLRRSRHKRPSEIEQIAEGDTQPDPIRRVLQTLSDLREFEHVGNGYWLPTPMRLVELPVGNTALVIGGIDTSTVRQSFHAGVKVVWLTRTLDRNSIEDSVRSDRSLWQTLRDYLGNPPDSLSEWTDSFLRRAAHGQLPSASGYGRFDVYLPKNNVKRPQYFRWVQAERLSRLPSGIVLCRAAEGSQWGPRRYWLGKLIVYRGEFQAESEFRVEWRDVTRLQYGIDHLEGCPTRVLLREQGEQVLIQLENILPPEERRLLMALGKDISQRPGHFPVAYQIPQTLFEDVKQRLDGLGVSYLNL